MKQRVNFMKALEYHQKKDELDRRESLCMVGAIGSVTVGAVLFLARSPLPPGNLSTMLCIGGNVAFGLVSIPAYFGVRNSRRQALADEFPKSVETEFEGMLGALATEPESPEKQSLLTLDHRYTELCGSTPVPTEDPE